MIKEHVFNLRIAGIGGRGVVGLATTIAGAAASSGVPVSVIDRPRSAMRLGPITCDVILGSQGFAPFIAPGDADVVLALEPLDGLANAQWLLKTGGTAIISNLVMPTIDELVSGVTDVRRHQLLETMEKRSGKMAVVDVTALEDVLGPAVNYYLLGIMVVSTPGFPVPANAIREELAARPEALAGFEKGLRVDI